jgi:tetratricopeptide (TPR) repeat protein/predicted aspartyl protease
MSRSTRTTLYALIVINVALAAPAPLLANCALKQVAQLPIDMENTRPTVAVQFNGRDARLTLDSGAFYSMISAATAAEYNLKVVPLPFNLRVSGVGGTANTAMTTVKSFGLLGLTLPKVEFLVGGSEVGSAGLLGQNLLEQFDDEYDLVHGAVRLYKTEGCGKSVLAYWAKPGEQFSVVNISRVDPKNAHTIGDASVNGKPIRVIFDTGAYRSILSLKAAQRAGITPNSPGVEDAGYSHGIGRMMVKSYVARFDSFSIGDNEEIKNTRLRIGELDFEGADMLLGADFFLSHRVFVSNQERKAFITYNGGAVFNLSHGAVSAAAPATPDAQASAGQAAADAAGAGQAAAETQGAQSRGSDTPTDAAGYARRGEGFAARQDFAHALADLSKACELKPDDPEYFYRRALLYLQTGDAGSALTDLNRVLEFKEDFLPAYLPRAEIYLHQKNMAAAQADLSSVDRLAPKQADLRLALGHAFAGLDNFSAATTQFGLWIDAHPEDARLVQALNSRCWVRAVQNQDLNLGLDDCSKALRRVDKHDVNTAQIYANRGMVRIRQGDYDKAIADFNDALKLQAEYALALYGRGVAESHSNAAGAATADIVAARAIEPKLPDRYQRFGIAP